MFYFNIVGGLFIYETIKGFDKSRVVSDEGIIGEGVQGCTGQRNELE